MATHGPKILLRLRQTADRNVSVSAEIARRLKEKTRRRVPFGRASALVGHELRDPLATALMYLAIARREIDAGLLGDVLSSALDTARGELRRLEGMLGRLMELMRADQPAIRPRSVDLAQAVRQAVTRTLELAPGLRSNLTVEADTGLHGMWDDMAAEQITQNLVANASKFGDGRPIRVVVERARIGARIVVQDEGRGISAADQRRVFDPGFRVPGSQREGLGLGLWLVRQLAEAHGGRVRVRSQPGEGATFTVTLREGVAPVPAGARPGYPLPSRAHPATRSRTASTMAAVGARPSTGSSSPGARSVGAS
jgi:signal transduction histidine kinase